MVLSDQDIKRRIEDGSLVIDPYSEDAVEPASVDLHLGDEFKVAQQADIGIVDAARGDDSSIGYQEVGHYTVYPETLVLATTKERVEIPDDMVAHVLGRSSLGRLGLSVHQTAGYIDPGFNGEITLELSNHGPLPVRLDEGLRICQIVFEELSSEAEEPYGHEGSQYQEQSGATPSGMDFDRKL